MSHPILAELGPVPADFIKYFLMVTGFILFVWERAKGARRVSGGRDEPVHVQSPIEVKPATTYADKEETAKAIHALNTKIDSVARESLRQQNAQVAEANEIIKAGAARHVELLKELHAMEQRLRVGMNAEVTELHKRINPLQRDMGAVTAKLKIKSADHD